MHLVAPQVWAWAQWRVGKLRRYSDMVLCLLPFEPAWFEKRGVNARFIGHPLFDHTIESDPLRWQGMTYPGGSPKVALMPGSRAAEITRNWPFIHEAWQKLSERYSDAQAVVAGVNADSLNRFRELTPDIPSNMRLVHSQTDAVVHWADVVLAVSGTVSLHIARQSKPMVLMYKVNRWTWSMVGQFLINTRTFTLPNLIHAGRVEGGDKHIVKEFIPFLGGSVDGIVDEVANLIEDDRARAVQVEALDNIVAQFQRHNAGREAAETIVEIMRQDQTA